MSSRGNTDIKKKFGPRRKKRYFTEILNHGQLPEHCTPRGTLIYSSTRSKPCADARSFFPAGLHEGDGNHAGVYTKCSEQLPFCTCASQKPS